MWEYRGQKRPDFAAAPGPGQESVWDYTRPPKLTTDRRLVKVFYDDQEVASSSRTYRVLETASPPSFYIPPNDVNWELLSLAPQSSVCEWKGVARYWALSSNSKVGIVGWSYPHPKPAFEQIRYFISFYPSVWRAMFQVNGFALRLANFMAVGLQAKSSDLSKESREQIGGNW